MPPRKRWRHHGAGQALPFSDTSSCPSVAKPCHIKREGRGGKGNRGVVPRFLASLRPFRQTTKELRKRNAGKRTVVSPAPNGCGRATEDAAYAALPLSGALACRRSTTALAKGCVVPWCDPGQASWTVRPRGGGHSADGQPTSSDAPRTPVVMPAGMMPGPPGSQADEASPAGTAPAPLRPASPGRRPYRAR